jgi:hypothetical protein
MYSGKREKAATTHRGTVTGIHQSPGRGFRMEFEIPVQALGSKIVVEHNGMKYVRTNLPDHVKVPKMALFGDRHLDGIASLHDVLSKEATGGLVSSFGNAFTTLGMDFTADVKKFFGEKNTADAIKILRDVAAYSQTRSVDEIYELQSLLAGQSAYVSAITSLVQPLTELGTDTSWLPNIGADTPEASIVRAMMIYLMSPGADVDFILQTSGFFVDNPSMPSAVSRKMPELFTRAFDLAAPDSIIRVELERRLNAKLNKQGKEGWHLDTNSWELEGRTIEGKTIRGMLQYGESHVSEDNPLLNAMAQERKLTQSATLHQGLMNRIGTGGLTLTQQKKLGQLTAIRQQNLTDPEQIKSMWRDLTWVDPSTHGPGARWQRRTVAEHKFYNRSLMRMGQYRHAIDFTSDVFKNEDQLLTDIQQAIRTIRVRTGLRPQQEEIVHYWLRQVMYHPAEGADQDAFSGDLAPRDVLGATKTILGNLDRGYLPTYDGAGPSFFSYHDLQILFQAYQRGESKFAPWRKEGDRTTAASKDNLGEWISIAFAQGINESVDFDPIYRLDFSGFMNTYQTVLKNSGYMMDITFDKEYQGKLLDPQSNEMLNVSIDPVENRLLTEQIILATAGLDYDDLMNGATGTGSPEAMASATAWRQRRLDSRARWRKRHAVRPVKVQSSRDFYRNGIEQINRDADMHSLQRIVIALRHGTAMLNPGLYFSMIPEQGFRMYLSEMANLLQGTSTLKTVRAGAKSVEWTANKVSAGRWNFQLGAYTGQQVDQLNNLFTTLGNDGGFTALIIKDMMWHKNPASPGKIVDVFEKYASIGNKWQDPTWGTTQKGLARHYVEAIMREIEANPTRYVMSLDSVIASLRTDPAFFAKHHPDLHRDASNAVVDFRSLKQTPWSLAFKKLYDPWTHSPNMGKRFVGTLVKLNLMYMNYNMNVLTTLTGMQGYTQLTSAFFHGAQTPNSLVRMWLKGVQGKTPTDEDYRTFDLSSALDGVDIANSFIKGGVTQTGLFMLGMVAGGVLSGEDDEAKRRRRLAEAAGVPLIMDPRKLENDFRNKDMIFMDWLPPQLNAFFRVQNPDGTVSGRAGVQMSWLLKPFMSPIMGMERFFQTGDFSNVIHGFQDAISSMPMFNLSKWDDAVRSAHELESLAADEQMTDTPTSLKNTMYLLTSAVGVLESMLVENMFVNSLYTGFDLYDRDPSKMVLRDSDGDVQKNIEGNPRPNDLAMEDYVKDDGTIGRGYQERDPITAQLASMTENNFTAAAVLSLFTGFQKDLLRSQMPETIRTIDLPELDPEEAKVAIMLATLNGQKAQGKLERRLSLDEVTYKLKGKFMKAKDWDSYNNLDALAKRFYESSENPVMDPLSVLGPNEQEIMTKSGHIALFKGLVGGTITLDDPLFRQIGITYDERKALEAEFFSDFVRQGTDMGMPQSAAEFRATRLMVGPKDDPTILGFKDVLYDKRIPDRADAKYKQLNTTYVTGPDGFPWATGFKRGGAPGFGGFWSLLGGFKRPTTGMSNAITEDGRLNSVDNVRRLDTGMRGLVPMDPSEEVPTDRELTKSIIDAIKGQQANQAAYEPNSQESTGGGGFYRRGYGGYGGGSGGKGYSPTIYWSRQPTLPRGTNVYGNSVKNLFWNNANIRRTTIRRERYQSSRERLNQWQ